MGKRGVNKVILVGNLGQDPDVRYMPNGNAVANVSIATSESWKDQQGQEQERTSVPTKTQSRRTSKSAQCSTTKTCTNTSAELYP